MNATYTKLLAAEKTALELSRIEQAEIEVLQGKLDWMQLCELPAFAKWQEAAQAARDFETNLMRKHFERARKVAPLQHAITMAAFRKAGMTLEQAMVSHVRDEMIQLALGMEK